MSKLKFALPTALILGLFAAFYFGVTQKQLDLTEVMKICVNKDRKSCQALWLTFAETPQGKEFLVKNSELCDQDKKKNCNVAGWVYAILNQFDKAQKFMAKSCFLGDSQGCTALGQQYKRQKNFYEAKFYFIKACDQYNINGCQLAGEVLLIHEKKVADAEPFLTMACRGQNQIGCYNLACVHALLNKKNKALHSLEEALKLGFKEWEHVLKDPDLKNIQKLKDFGNLIEKYKKLKIN